MGSFREFNPLMLKVGWTEIDYTYQVFLEPGMSNVEQWATQAIRLSEAREWCNGIMIRGRWSYRYNYKSVFLFKDARDLLPFKLAWGGAAC